MGTEITRKLATIERIDNVQHHSNADALDFVTVKGWNIITKRDEFKIGDLCVFFEIDSFLPVRPEFEFMRKNCFKSTKNLGDGFRVRTMRLRGQLSQGLVLPLSSFNFELGDGKWTYVGADVTEALKVQKYEKPISANLAGKAKGYFPSFIRRTDQERVQNEFATLKNKHWDESFEVTMKLDGSSMTMYYKEVKPTLWMRVKKFLRLTNKVEGFGVCSRNLELDMDQEGNSFVDVAKALQFKVITYCKTQKRNLAFQGELMGPGIQGNREGLKTKNFYLFDIFDIDNQKYLLPKERMEINRLLMFKECPLIRRDLILSSLVDLDGILKYADRPSLEHDICEGIVFKSNISPGYSFKAINNKFLEKEKD